MLRALRTLGRPLLGVLACGAACGAFTAGSAQADIAWAPCGNSNELACGHLTVPLSWSGATPGVLTLAMHRHRAPVGDERSAVIALAGGPGQPALPFTEQFIRLLGPIIATRDLIVFDQRGIGLSHPLSCHRFERALIHGPPGPAIGECGAELGPARSYYTTDETVADIEAIRQAGGYEKLVLYGTSYGTKVAERYAQSYPGHVEALVLDSVVPPNGPEPLNRPTIEAVPRILHDLCAHRSCARITRSPVDDLAKVVARAERRALRGRFIDGRGRPHRVTLSSADLLEILLEGDLEPALRAEFPAAIRSAANGDNAPLARLAERAQSAGESEAEAEGSETFDAPLYYATSCEEELFPWNRAATPKTRIAEAAARVKALGPRAIRPFTRRDLLAISDVPACAFWPYSTPPPAPVQAPFPAVPTLILSGEQDLRTPTANAREVAAQIPGAHLLVVPQVGHSVLGSDLSGCASAALQALFAHTPIRPCTAVGLPALLSLTPLAPRRLVDVAATPGYRGLPGKTLDALTLTLADFVRQAGLQVISSLASGNLSGLATLRAGGLRAGWGQLHNSALSLHGYSYIPGMTVSGTLTSSGAVLRVGGPAAARGTMRLGPHNSLIGTLGGEHVALVDHPSAGDAIVGADALASPLLGRRGSAARAGIRSLAGLVDRLP